MKPNLNEIELHQKTLLNYKLTDINSKEFFLSSCLLYLNNAFYLKDTMFVLGGCKDGWKEIIIRAIHIAGDLSIVEENSYTISNKMDKEKEMLYKYLQYCSSFVDCK